jgi:hypothetical protein
MKKLIQIISINRLRPSISNTANRSKLIISIIPVTWLLILTYNIHFNPNSKYKYYVKSNAQYMRSFDKYKNESLISLDLMQQWLKENNIEKPIFNKLLNRNQKNILCVGIMSMRRVMSSSSFKLKHRFYTIQTVVSLLTRVQFKYQDRIAINIFNLNRNKSIALDEHRDLMLLDNLIQIINITDMSESNSSNVIQPVHKINSIYSLTYPKAQELCDYANIMKYYHVNRTECDNVLLLEDDSIASHDWYEKICNALNKIQSQSFSSSKWLCLKLFTSFRYYDFFIHLPTVLNIIFYSFLFTLVQMFILFIIMSKRSHFMGDFLLLFVNTLFIHLYLKSTHISPLGYGLHEFSLGFNTVANVYPNKILGKLSSFIKEYYIEFCSKFGTEFHFDLMPKDVYLKFFKTKFNLKEFILEPSVFQHVGLQSSLGASESALNSNEFYKKQYKPFQSWSYIKEYSTSTDEISFNTNRWSLS